MATRLKHLIDQEQSRYTDLQESIVRLDMELKLLPILKAEREIRVIYETHSKLTELYQTNLGKPSIEWLAQKLDEYERQSLVRISSVLSNVDSLSQNLPEHDISLTYLTFLN